MCVGNSVHTLKPLMGGSYTVAATCEGCLTAHCLLLLLSVLFLGRKAFLKPLHLRWKKKSVLSYSEIWRGGGVGEGNDIKSELYIRSVPELFCPACIQLKSESGTVSLVTSVVVNQIVGGNVPGQWIAIAHASEALRLSLV